MRFTVKLTRPVQAYLARLDVPTRDRMEAALELLANDPYHPGTKQLTNARRLRSVRVGGWRIVYRVDDGDQIVIVETIAPRGQVYRRL